MRSAPPLLLAARASDAHKGTFGRVLLVGGSRGMSGSISLSSIAALHCGSGLVTAAVPDRCLESVAACHPALMTVALADDPRGRFSLDAWEQLAPRLSGVDAIGCGPGITTEAGSLRLVEQIVQVDRLPRVLDADALNCLAILAWPQTVARSHAPISLVLTPHPGELQRLTGVSPSQRSLQLDAAQALADRAGAVIVVKGGPTVVIGPRNQESPSRWTNANGNPGMATAGSGDVLTGVIASLLGQGLSSWDAARLGVWIHGQAGDLASQRQGEFGMTAKEIVHELPRSIAAAVADAVS